MMRRHELPFPRLAVFFTCLTGAAICYYGLTAEETLCLTETCAIHQSFTIAGASLWWFGLVLFGCLTAIAFWGRPDLGCTATSLALLCDCPLLLLMVVTAPCATCILIGVLLAAAHFLFTYRQREWQHFGQKTGRSPFIPVLWLICFIMAAGLFLHDTATPWAIHGPNKTADMKARIYFSPACPACKQLVLSIPDPDINSISWCPVAEDEQGVLAVAAMREALTKGMPFKGAFLASQNASSPSHGSLTMLPLQIRLLLNHAHVLAGGRNALPYITIYGLSRLQPTTAIHHSRPAPSKNNSDDLSFLDAPVNECTGDPRPCK